MPIFAPTGPAAEAPVTREAQSLHALLNLAHRPRPVLGSGEAHGRSMATLPSQPSPAYDPADLAEEVDLELEKKHRILDLFARLDELSYYDLLGIAAEADKKQVKAAYYKLAPEFHPDTYFRKNLGSYKPRIEAIFTRITLAHDVLSAKQRRAEYDAYLAQTVQNRTIAEALAHGDQELRAVEESIEAAARAVEPAADLTMGLRSAASASYAPNPAPPPSS